MVAFDRDFDPAYGAAVEIAPGVRRVTAENPSPFTFRGTNTYLVGTRRLAVIDPGPQIDAHLAALDAAVGGACVAAVLVSHRHVDHTAAAAVFARRHGGPLMAFPVADAPEAPPLHRIDAARDRALPVDHALADEEVVDAGDIPLRALHTPGHAADHLCFAAEEAGLLFSADHVMGWSTTVVAPPDGSMRDYMASLERLLGRDDARYLPGHGGDIRQPRRFVRGLQTHRRQRETGILERLAAGDRTVPEIVARLYAGVDPRLHGAAGLSVLAHLEDLEARGLVARGTARDGEPEFRPTN